MILDTSALSAFAEGDEGAGDVVRSQRRVFIPLIVLAEYRYGVSRSKFRKHHEAWLASELKHFQLLPVVAETTFRYAELRLELKKKGLPIPANDAWIAALALQHGQPVLTKDRHFAHISSIKCLGW